MLSLKINEESGSESGNHQISDTPANAFDEELIKLWRECWRDYGQVLELRPEIWATEKQSTD